jgi:hypothetical protein
MSGISTTYDAMCCSSAALLLEIYISYLGVLNIRINTLGIQSVAAWISTWPIMPMLERLTFATLTGKSSINPKPLVMRHDWYQTRKPQSAKLSPTIHLRLWVRCHIFTFSRHWAYLEASRHVCAPGDYWMAHDRFFENNVRGYWMLDERIFTC